MKKLLFLLVLINAFAFSQMKPGIDYMPHIGFFDFIINYFGLTLPETGITGLT